MQNRVPRVTVEAAEAYAAHTGHLLERVNSRLENHPRITELIGSNPLELMYDNHRNHAAFMATVLRLDLPELLVRTLPWVYRACHSRGFSYSYFPVELVAWQEAISECIEPPEQRTSLRAVYEWILQQHEETVRRSLSDREPPDLPSSDPDSVQQRFLSLLLQGDSRGCLSLAMQTSQTAEDMKAFYSDVVWPVMVRIGYLWESNQITVAEEHLATAIVGRLMAGLYQRFVLNTASRGTVVVCAAPNEFHEIGARMVADFLEMDGWEVSFLGANTPPEELLRLLNRLKPFAVALSVATVFNLDKVRQAIGMIRGNLATAQIRILVGGPAFDGMPQLWQSFGADGYAPDADSATLMLDTWWTGEKV